MTCGGTTINAGTWGEPQVPEPEAGNASGMEP